MFGFLLAAACPAHIVSFAIRAPNSPAVKLLAAKRFCEVYEIPNFLSLPAEVICEIVGSKECARPGDAEMAKFVARALRRHGEGCAALVGMVHLERAKIRDLEAIESLGVCPSIAKAIESRLGEMGYDRVGKGRRRTETRGMCRDPAC
jgi:hypothetical protein